MNVKKQFRNRPLRNCAVIALVCNGEMWYLLGSR